MTRNRSNKNNDDLINLGNLYLYLPVSKEKERKLFNELFNIGDDTLNTYKKEFVLWLKKNLLDYEEF